MSLQRQIERLNLKKNNETIQKQLTQLIRINGNLHEINEKMNKNINELYCETKTLKDVITAMTISDIRNHNYTTSENKKVIIIPYSFLSEVTKKYTVKMVTSSDDMLTIEPVELERDVDFDEEGVANDETEQGNPQKVTERGEDT